MRRLFGFLLAFALSAGLVQAQTPGREGPGGAAGGPQQQAPRRGPPPAAPSQLPPLPPPATTHHTLQLAAGRTLNFTATAGTIRLFDANSGVPQADIATIAFTLDGAEPGTRPVTFVFNGGPGYASGWLNLGGLGPWRLPLSGDADRPSASPTTIDNADTWLDFTDLVFIDPAGTGYSRILGGDDVKRSFYSVNGDIQSLAAIIRRWVDANNRFRSPKFIAGESYGGFRAPKIVRQLQDDQGIGIAGIVMISPVLDFGRFNASSDPLGLVARLPNYAAVARSAKGPITRADLADVEQYAQGDYLQDLLKGVNDRAAVDRLSAKVAQLTGLDPALVARFRGRVPVGTFRRSFDRRDGRVLSQYDGTVSGIDPEPLSPFSHDDDQLRLGLHAPISQAMVDLYHTKLNWNVENGRYQFFNEEAGRQWNYGRNANATDDLEHDLALDPKFRAVIVHGLTDLVTPYFGTKMELDQLAVPTDGRITFDVLPGGHMIYINDNSRAALRDDARKLMEAK
ncbi:MAG TPA: peptidase S10 [Beijerinckiaceae bacterium]|nr:peptidase S10 [Beijerinckiaceae bacterium]